MKKSFLIFIIGIITIIPLFSDTNITENQNQVALLIEDDLFANFVEIKDLSFKTDINYREDLFIMNQLNPRSTILWNMVVPFGVGSFIQRDTKGGIIMLSGDVLSLSLMSFGYLFGKSHVNTGYEYDPYSTGVSKELLAGSIILTTGGIIYLSNLIYKIIRPIKYTESYNKKLSDALHIDEKLSVDFEPNFNINPQGEMIAMLNFRLTF